MEWGERAEHSKSQVNHSVVVLLGFMSNHEAYSLEEIRETMWPKRALGGEATEKTGMSSDQCQEEDAWSKRDQ